MKHSIITVVIVVGGFLLFGYAGSAFSQENPDPERLVYPTKKQQDEFEKWVGLEKGSGPWSDYYKPVPLHMYWAPKRHYIRPDLSAFEGLIDKYDKTDCLGCHEEVTPGIVLSWRQSTHANPRKNPEFAEKLRAIEERIGESIDRVTCDYCHGPSHDKLFLPNADDVCKRCHPQQVEEFASEYKDGRPSHQASWISNVVVPWYVEGFRRGEGYSFIGCDQCHPAMDRCDPCHTRHSFKAEEARRPEACMSCHMGADHPDAETYKESKMGVIYALEGDTWAFDKGLNEIKLGGPELRSPTCQVCHMYNNSTGKWGHNVTSKGRWRMGTYPPKEVEYKSSMKDYPYGITIPPLDKKIEIYSPENKKKLERWVELCSNCHSGRFARLWFESLDEYMFAAYRKRDEAQLIVEDCIEKGYIDTDNRGIYPMGDVLADKLGVKLLGEKVYKAFKQKKGHVPVVGPILGVYANFMYNDGNPSAIEVDYGNMWFWYALKGYKGVAHGQQDYAWWWGWAPMVNQMSRIKSQHDILERVYNIEKKLGIGLGGSRTDEN
ncbi:MAG: hydroxylamine oxidoreductase [Candidatus Scalindua sp.]|nr:hydroxylamine oxidoreductase [Candidatus Scalindua sp.]